MREYTLSVVTPVFNEDAVIEEFYRRTSGVLARNNVDYEIVFVDDGSRDRSYEILKRLHDSSRERVKVIRLARNFGHQLAITAGMRGARGKAVVIMDSDLQDPPEVIVQFLAQWQMGAEIVYGIRTERKGETFFKKFTAALFYKLIRATTNIDIPESVGDFYLLDRKVVEVLNGMEERHRFMRGLVAWVGYRRMGVGYVREARFAGHTKFGFWKMVKFSFDAATTFSFAPLRTISFVGSVISALSFLSLLVILYLKLFNDRTVLGWSSLMAAVLFIGGMQLLAIGIIGEYIARIGDDVKRRPLYTVLEKLE